MNIDPKTLKLFISVVKHGTISAAANSEHIATAAVSRRISDLENQLGTQLLSRSNRGIEVTAAGHTLYDLSLRLLNDINDIGAQMQSYALGIKGHVRVFVNISTITQFMASDLRIFLDRNPHVQIHLEEHVSSVIIKAIRENSADIGVVTGECTEDDVELIPYRNDELVMVVPKSHPLTKKKLLTFKDTIEYDFVGLPIGSQINKELIRAASDINKPWRCRFKVPSYDTLCLMVEAELGIGVLPRLIANKYASVFDLSILELNETWTHRKLFICIRSYDALTASAKELVDCMVNSPVSLSNN